MTFEFIIHQERANFPIAMLCRVLDVSRSGYYRWRSAVPRERSMTDARLKPKVAALHAASGGTYGSPRIHADLVEEGFEVGRNRVARLMRELGLSAAHVKATIQSPPFGSSPGLHRGTEWLSSTQPSVGPRPPRSSTLDASHGQAGRVACERVLRA